VGKDNKKIVLSVFLLIFAACGRNERAEKNEKAGKTGRIVRAEKNEKAGRSLLFQHNLR
jgi:lipoprotein